MSEANMLERQVNQAHCPQCGSGVFAPLKAIRECFGGDNDNDKDIQVWCRDMGHWIGFLSECD